MKCPGQDSRFWKPGAIFEVKCPNCGGMVEFFKDDTARKCPECGHRFVNPHMDFGCAAYCQFAEQCLGTLPPEVVAQREELLKDRVAMEMKRYFNQDNKRIRHANKVAHYAERIGKSESANLAVVLIAAYLHDIGISKLGKNSQETSSRELHQREGEILAEEILTRLGANTELIREVKDIIGHHHNPGADESLNFKVLYDADQLVNLEENPRKVPTVPEELEKVFLTPAGKKLARERLSTKDPANFSV